MFGVLAVAAASQVAIGLGGHLDSGQFANGQTGIYTVICTMNLKVLEIIYDAVLISGAAAILLRD
ncbi:MAG UNVERIFIED_CONTAM: hypothetical protein LVR29_13640 [Microcystis novacekii LVE1205-3]